MKYEMQSRAQISFEYVFIIGIVLLIALPSLYLFRGYVVESNDKIVAGAVERAANGLISTATEIYYRGVPSKIVLQIEMPQQIQYIRIIEVSSNEYYLVFNVSTSDGSLELVYDSPIPIKKGSFTAKENCYNSKTTCKIYSFSEIEVSSGIKNFKIEAKQDGVYIDGT